MHVYGLKNILYGREKKEERKYKEKMGVFSYYYAQYFDINDEMWLKMLIVAKITI